MILGVAEISKHIFCVFGVHLEWEKLREIESLVHILAS